MNESGTWTALRNPVFRRLWIATVISGTCVAAHDSAATWMINSLTGSPLLISLMSTLASLPFFLFTLPAGALADKVDRQKLICFIYVGLAATAGCLAVLGSLHLLNPTLILVSVFCIGVGFAFNAPAWTSIVPQVVSDSELPSAATLSGLQFNISGIIGPALGGVLVALAGANFVFALNAACFFLVLVAIRQWKQPSMPAKPSSESFFESFGTVIRYARSTPSFQVVLGRNLLFGLFISVLPALMPVVGLKVLHLSSSSLRLLFTSMGALLLVLVYLFMAFVRQVEVFFVVAALAGVGWTLSASELWVASQRAMPTWARGRMNAMVIMISQGAMAVGGVIWGSAASIAGANYTLLGAAVLFLASLLPARRLSINVAESIENKVSGVLSVRVESEELTPIALAEELLAV
jgi:MFS family permease